MRIAFVLALVACRPPPLPLSNVTTEHRTAVDIGVGSLSVAVPPGVVVYANRALLLWSTEELDTAWIELFPPHAPSLQSVFIAPVPTAFDVTRFLREGNRRVAARRGADPIVADDNEVPSLIVHRRDLGVFCEVTATEPRASIEAGARICDSLRR